MLIDEVEVVVVVEVITLVVDVVVIRSNKADGAVTLFVAEIVVLVVHVDVDVDVDRW